MMTSFPQPEANVNKLYLGYDHNATPSDSPQCALKKAWQATCDEGVATLTVVFAEFQGDIRNIGDYYLFSNVAMTTNAPDGYYAQYVYNESEGEWQYWWLAIVNIGGNQFNSVPLQYLAGDLHGLYTRNSTSGSVLETCYIDLKNIYFPPDTTFANTTALWLDPFGCQLATFGYYHNPTGTDGFSLLRYWYSTNGGYFYTNATWLWNMNTGLDYNDVTSLDGGIPVNYSISAVDSVCTPNNDFPSLVWQSCSDTPGTLQYDRAMLTFALNTSTGAVEYSFAPTGYYFAPVNIADFSTRYWDGESGTWGGLCGLTPEGIWGGFNNMTIDCGG